MNVDTAAGEVGLTVRAECVGRGLRSADRRRKSVGDDRAAVFRVKLPDPATLADPSRVRVVLEDANESARGLLGFGAFLVTVREALNLADGIAGGEITDGAAAAAASRDRVGKAAALADSLPVRLPSVTLPGGVDMAEALAAVAWIQADPERAAAFKLARGTP